MWYPCQTRSYFILRKLHELDPARFNTVMTNLYHEQEKKPQDITKVESGPEGIKDVQVKMVAVASAVRRGVKDKPATYARRWLDGVAGGVCRRRAGPRYTLTMTCTPSLAGPVVLASLTVVVAVLRPQEE